MSLSLDFHVIADHEGHGESLLLKGDWLFVMISDGVCTGLGEATHNGDDRRCRKVIAELFSHHVKSMQLSLENIRQLEQGAFAEAPDFLTATAISAINQALYDLLARREQVPVWQLFRPEPARRQAPVYVTINRVLGRRDIDDYRDIIGQVRRRGFTQFKCAPFELVGRHESVKEQLDHSRDGLDKLRTIAAEFGELGMRIDFHARFGRDAFWELLDELESLEAVWLEEPFAIGADYGELRLRCKSPIAAGELYFGAEDFRLIVEGGWADVIMPDVKHVGGFGPLLDVCRLGEVGGVEVSPHNPSGPIATLASLHAAAVADNVTSLELPFASEDRWPASRELIRDGALHLPDGPGWGIDFI